MPFRGSSKSDLDILAHEKDPKPLCVFFRQLAVDSGLADIELEYHVLVPKVIPAQDRVCESVFLLVFFICLVPGRRAVKPSL